MATLQRGRIDYDQIAAAVRQGEGGFFQMFGGGATTAGHVAVYDADGNVVDGGAASSVTEIDEVPVGAMNGSNVTFTLSQTPAADSLELYLNGIFQRPSIDYTLSGSTITYTIPPRAADTQQAVYQTTGVGGGGTDVPITIGFIIGDGTPGTNIGPMLAAPRAGSLSKCVIITKAADASAALTFQIKRNGTNIFSSAPTVAAGTASGTVSTSTSLTSSPLSVAANDVFSIDITSGAASWQFTAQLE